MSLVLTFSQTILGSTLQKKKYGWKKAMCGDCCMFEHGDFKLPNRLWIPGDDLC